MPDLRFLIAHGLTVSGASLLLGAVSYGRWAADISGARARDAMAADPAVRAAVVAGVIAMALGRNAAATARVWEPIFWLAAVILTFWGVRYAARR